MHTNGALAGQSECLREAFLNAKPFRHLVIDEFFQPDFAERLLEQFPSFDKRLARAESGEVGGKSVNTRIAQISQAYQDLYREISSPAFLDLISKLSGVPDLILDPAMFGGGTHENLHGQELDPHVDFNYDEAEKMHRRLNLIVYLNKGWKSEWGGGLEIHSNPRRPEENQVESYEPLFNRAVIFETNEYSWHGFSKIALPEDQRHLSRKSISIYLYTKDRPAEQTAPRHATFYVQRPLPERFADGYTLRAEDVLELRTLLVRRDRWIELYQQMELDTNRLSARLQTQLLASGQLLRAPVTGYIRQDGAPLGYSPDSWAAPVVRLQLKALEPVVKLELKGYRPDDAGTGHIRMLVDGSQIGGAEVSGGNFSIKCALPSRAEGAFELEIRFAGPAAPHGEGDDRQLAFILVELRAHHPLATAFSQRSARA